MSKQEHSLLKEPIVGAMAALSATHDVNCFKGVAEYAHVYMFWNENKIVVVGSISGFWGSLTESILLTIFVLPKFHGQGIGSYIIDTLKSDELFLRAERIEIPASITVVEFYRKKGYRQTGKTKVINERLTLIILFRDMLNETLYEFHNRNGFFHVFVIFVPVVMESHKVTIGLDFIFFMLFVLPSFYNNPHKIVGE